MVATTRPSNKKRVAVIGSGIAGLSAAWLLGKSASVTLYEAEMRPGGHANTVDVETADGPVAIDTGFIVYNERNYPNLVALFKQLGVPTQLSDMSFAASLDQGRFEYSGSGLKGLLGQKTNLMRPRFWRMVNDIRRFYREAPGLLAKPELASVTLGEYLDAADYSAAFIEDHLLPMGAAIWSTTAREMRAYPLFAFIRFFERHGLLLLKDRPRWRTVCGGSRTYVSRLLEDFSGELRLHTPVLRVYRGDDGVTVLDGTGHSDTFDDVVIAVHADQALAMLDDPSPEESRLLGAFAYTPNTAVLHKARTLMPRRRSVWSSWNYVSDGNGGDDAQLCVTYWMNQLQNLGTREQFFVTLNPIRPIPDGQVIRAFDYAHPLFDRRALSAQSGLHALQGKRNTWFCGAYFGSGFHEDGIKAGLAVAEELSGIERPWVVEAGAPPLTGLVAAE